MKQKHHFYSSRKFGPVTANVVFFFTALGTHYWLYLPAIKLYTKAGYHVVVYDASATIIFDADIDKFLLTGKAIVKDVEKQVSIYKKQGVKHFYTHGTSMGTLFAMRSAIDIPDIKKVIINLTYGRLADNLWNWYVLRTVKKRVIKQGMTQEIFEEKVKHFSPIALAAQLKGKKVLLYLAKKDRVMLFRHTSQFKAALDKAGVDYKYVQNEFFGHQIAGSLNNLRSKIYLEFLKS